MGEADRIEFRVSLGIKIDRVRIVAIRNKQAQVPVAGAFGTRLSKVTIVKDQSLLLLFFQDRHAVGTQEGCKFIRLSR